MNPNICPHFCSHLPMAKTNIIMGCVAGVVSLGLVSVAVARNNKRAAELELRTTVTRVPRTIRDVQTYHDGYSDVALVDISSWPYVCFNKFKIEIHSSDPPPQENMFRGTGKAWYFNTVADAVEAASTFNGYA